MSLKRLLIVCIKLLGLFVSLMLVGGMSTFITLWLSTSGDQVVVPDLKGKDPVEAIQMLGHEGLQLKIFPQKRWDDKIPADRIVAQEPVANSTIKQGRSVRVYLSLGPQKIVVPDVVGQTTRVGNMSLEQNNLHSGRIIYVTYPGAEPDEIIAQYPLSGTEVTTLRAVDLLANNGQADVSQAFVMPDVIGQKADQVQDFFRSSGLRVASSQPVFYPGIQPGVIVKQSPPAGYKLTRDSYIGLFYSR